MQSVSTFFKEEDDFLYQRGEKVRNQTFVKNLIVKLGFTDEQAADFIEVDIDFVKKVRAELNNK